MWLGLILTLALGFGLARLLVSVQFKEIIDNWKSYRCLPQVMVMAGIFKPSDDPRSSFDYTSDNFSFCSSELAKAALSVALKPVFDIFYQLTSSATQSIGFTMNLRTLASNLFSGINRMFDVFNRRFNLTLHELHKGFIKQYSAIQKANSIANAAVFAGISFIQSIMNFIKFMVTIVIVIAVILVVLAILFFWMLAPVTPLILATLVTAGAFGGSVGNMAESFCFSPSTQIILENGRKKPISEIKIGDVLLNGSEVTSIMKFGSDKNTDLRNLDGIHVSGSHIVYDNNKAIFVKEHKLNIEISCSEKYLYCLNTSDHKIPVLGLTGVRVFADWEELDKQDMGEWATFVNSLLNSDDAELTNLNTVVLESESGVDQSTPILYKCGEFNVPAYKTINEIAIGDIIKDGSKWTKVIGTVCIAGSECLETGSIDGFIGSSSNWVYAGTKWIRAVDMEGWKPVSPVSKLYSLFTESGSFTINKTQVRDFSEVGLQNISSTYNFTLSRLLNKYSSHK
jgi:hypothetical protein